MSAPGVSWIVGDYLTHRFNPELGIGRVTALDGRALIVEFPRSEARLRLAANTDVLIRVDLSPGRPVRITATREETTVATRLPDGALRLANGRSPRPTSLAHGARRRTARTPRAWRSRQRRGLRDPPGHPAPPDSSGSRWPWAPSSVDACDSSRISFTLRSARAPPTLCAGCSPTKSALARHRGLAHPDRLVHAGKIERCLVVAPDTLTVQWLGELWRKYHQVFTLLDAQRLADVTATSVRRSIRSTCIVAP